MKPSAQRALTAGMIALATACQSLPQAAPTDMERTQIRGLVIQNRSYAGASINPPHDIDEAGLIGFVKDEGRLPTGRRSSLLRPTFNVFSLPGEDEKRRRRRTCRAR